MHRHRIGRSGPITGRSDVVTQLFNRRTFAAHLGVARVPWAGVVRRALPALVLVGSLAAFVVLRQLVQQSSLDLIIYRGEGLAVRSGQHLFALRYGEGGGSPTYQATYPPFAAVLFVPLSYVQVHVAIVLGLLANFALLAVAVELSFRMAGAAPANRAAMLCIAFAAALWMEPVYTTLQNGQVNLLLLVLILCDFVLLPGRRLQGAGTGIAAGIKVTPLLFVAYLLLTRRFRAAGTAVVIFAGTVLLSAIVVPEATWRYWTQLVLDTDRVGSVEKLANQSIRGVLARVEHSTHLMTGELVLVAVIAAAGLACAVLAHHRIGDAWGVPACAVTALLVSPISWTHHWVWCVPIAVLLWQQERRAFAGMLVFWTYIVWGVPGDSGPGLNFDTVQLLLSAWYVVFGLGFLLLTAVRISAVTAGIRDGVLGADGNYAARSRSVRRGRPRPRL